MPVSFHMRNNKEAEMIQVLINALTVHWFISRERVAKLNGARTGDALDARYTDAVNNLFTAVITNRLESRNVNIYV